MNNTTRFVFLLMLSIVVLEGNYKHGCIMDTDELDSKLQNVMDWGQYEAAAYRVLVRYGPLEASDVVVRANIPQGRVYDVLNRLHSKGIVIKQGLQPTQYAAQSPKQLIEPKQEAFDKMATETIESLEPAYEMNLEEEQHPAWVTTSISGLATQARDLFSEVNNRLWILERSFWFEEADIEKLQSLATDDVDVRILGWNPRKELNDIATKADNISVRQLMKVDKSFYLGDSDRVILNLDDGQTGIIFRDEAMANVLIERFDNLYEEASEVTGSNA